MGGSQSASQIAAWVAQNFSASTVDSVTLYDLTAPTPRAAPCGRGSGVGRARLPPGPSVQGDAGVPGSAHWIDGYRGERLVRVLIWRRILSGVADFVVSDLASRVPSPRVRCVQSGPWSRRYAPQRPEAIEWKQRRAWRSPCAGCARSSGPGRAAVVAVDGVDLDIADGEFLTLLGPSGSGKTTVLRMIAGFELPTAGTIELDGQ